MSNSKRMQYTIDNFPFELLRVGNKEKNSKKSDFGSIHQFSKIETSKNNLEDYEIVLPLLSSNLISYYIDPHGNNVMNPSFYVHLVLHPNWSEIDPKTNFLSKKESGSGRRLEIFWDKYIAAWNRECLKLDDNDRCWMMGIQYENVNDKTVFISSICKHPKYPKKHINEGRLNYDKSKTLSIALWTQDVTKRDPNADKKKKYNNFNPSKSFYPLQQNTQNSSSNDISTSMLAPTNDDFGVPGTNSVIYTKLYNN